MPCCKSWQIYPQENTKPSDISSPGLPVQPWHSGICVLILQMSVLRFLQHFIQWNLEQILKHPKRYSSLRPRLKDSRPFTLCSISFVLWRIKSSLIILANIYALLLYAQIPMLRIVAHLRTPLINETLACFLWSLIIYYFQRKCLRQSWLYPICFQEMYIFLKNH